ncbi:MAG: DUF2752 domain-containing protein [Actinomycetota bacterium]
MNRTASLIDPRAALAEPGVHIAAGAAAFVTAGVLSSSDDGIVLCPFRRCTGGYCPGCGLTRASGRLLRGDLVGSWQQHPYIIVGVLQAVVFTALWATGSRLWAPIRRRITPIVVANVTLLLAIWVARLATGSIPVPFG